MADLKIMSVYADPAYYPPREVQNTNYVWRAKMQGDIARVVGEVWKVLVSTSSVIEDTRVANETRTLDATRAFDLPANAGAMLATFTFRTKARYESGGAWSYSKTSNLTIVGA